MKRTRRTFTLDDGAYAELGELARESGLSRSRFLEHLIMVARPVLAASAQLHQERRRPWWARLLGLGPKPPALPPLR